MRRSAEIAHEEARKHGRKPSDVAVTVGVPVFLHNDLKRAYAAAQRGLSFYGALPFYNRLLARSGFEAPAAKIMDAAKRRGSAARRRDTGDAIFQLALPSDSDVTVPLTASH